MQKKKPQTQTRTTPARSFSPANQSYDNNSLSPTNNTRSDSPTSHSLKSLSDGAVRKYRQMPQTLNDTQKTKNNVPARPGTPDYVATIDSPHSPDRLAQYEHESLVKVVTRLRDANHLAAQYSTNGTNDRRQQYQPDSFPNQSDNTTTGFSQMELAEEIDNHVSQWLQSAAQPPTADEYEYNNNNSNNNSEPEQEDPLVMSTRELARAVATRVEEDEILETSRRQLKAEIYESKRLLQEQLHRPPHNNNNRPHGNHESPLPTSPNYNENSAGSDNAVVIEQLRQRVQQLEGEVKECQGELEIERERVSKCNEEIVVQSKLLGHETEQKNFVEMKIEEMRQQHVNENKKSLNSTANLEKQLEVNKREYELQLEERNKELESERRAAEVLHIKVDELLETLRDERKLQQETRVKLEEEAKFFSNEKNRLEGELAKFEDEKRKIEDHRRKYERAGTDVLKLLNDANQKVITLEEHKWRLEDKYTEQKTLYENEKRLFSQYRIQMENEFSKCKQQHNELIQRQQNKYEAEIVQQRQRYELEELEREKRFELERGEFHTTIANLRGEIDDLRSQVVVLSRELSSSRQSHTEGQKLWETEKEKIVSAHNAADARIAELDTERARLQGELDEDRSKFEGLKRLLA